MIDQDIQYDLEELDEIEYYEIISLDEIIKDNPTFIAFSREEIFNELYDFFKNTNKSMLLTDLFYKSNTTDIRNYVFVADASKKLLGSNEESDYEDDKKNINERETDEDIVKFINDFKVMTKMPYKESQKEKNKYYFALSYDIQSKNIRLKPYMKTTVELRDTEKKVNLFYPVSSDDDTNIPILGAYYRTPTAILDDYLSHKMSSHLMSSESFNYLDATQYSDINKLIEIVKPKMKSIIDRIKIDDDDFNLDYNNLNNILKKFNTSLEDIDINDFNTLRDHLQSVLDIKPHEIIYKKYKIKDITVSNDKIHFFDKIQGITKLLTFTDKMKEDYELIIQSLQDEKMNTNAPPLLYNNINDIVDAVINNDISIEEIIENLSSNKKVIVIDHSIDTLKNISANNYENIIATLEELTERFKSIQKTIKDIYEFHFIELYKDLKEIKEANNYDDYIGIPDVYKNDGNYEGMVEEDYDDMGIEISINKISNISLEKYWLSIEYKDAYGFIEMLKIVLPIIRSVQETANLHLSYDILCRELYNRLSGVPTKYEIMRKILVQAEMNVSDEYIKDIVKITPKMILNNDISQMIQPDVAKYVLLCNNTYLEQIHQMIYISIAWWSLQIQEDIIEDTLIFDMNLCSPVYIDKWSLDELPLKDSKYDRGVLGYLAEITKDIMQESGDYGIPVNIIKNSMKIIEDVYKDIIEHLRDLGKRIVKKKDKGSETYSNLTETIKEKKKNRLLNDYIDALLYMPSYKYSKIHKFLLGCCLQKIGKKFVPNSDIDPDKRKGLIAAKKKYAMEIQTNKPRYPMYVPIQDVKDVKESDKDTGDQMILLHSVYDKDRDIEQNKIIILDEWFEYMKDRSSLLPNKVLDEFLTQKGTKKAEGYAEQFIKCLSTTAVKKSIDFNDLFFKDTINDKNIMLYVCKLFNKYSISGVSNENEKMLLKSAITCIQDILKDFDKLVIGIDEYNKQDINRIKKYISARALCLPFNVDNAKNNILYASVEVSNDFVSRICKYIFDNVIAYMRMVKMPTIEDNTKFINTIREQNKVKILNVMNTKSVEERELMNTLKKFGIKYQEGDDEIVPVNPEITTINPDIEGENEFDKGNEDEYDDNNLDVEDYGFIFS